MKTKRLLILSDGKPGHVNQSIAYAKYLGYGYDLHPVNLKKGGGRDFPTFLTGSDSILKNCLVPALNQVIIVLLFQPVREPIMRTGLWQSSWAADQLW